jgi:two-component sensor histidine kinase
MLNELSGIAESPGHDLAKEANHRIANNLSVVAAVVRTEAARIDPSRLMTASEVRDLLQTVGSRIDAIGQLHRLLAKTPSGRFFDIGEYLTELVESLRGSIVTDSSLTCEVSPGCHVPPAIALNVGLIVGELVTNAIKYAHPAGVDGWIEVSCRPGPDGSLRIEVTDDGVGLPEKFDSRSSGNIGTRLVGSLAQQIGGDLAFCNEGLGLRCILTLPASILR